MFVYRLILLWELSLGGKLLPFLGVRRLRRRRENIEECHGVTTFTAMVAAFHCQGSFYCFCSLLFLGVCVLLASWWYKLSMRLLVSFSKSERGSRTVLVLVHTDFSHPVFVCVFRAEQCDVLRGSKFSPRNFLLPPNVYVSNFPVFSPKPSGFPLISAYIVLTFELCLCIGIDFNFCQISSPKR